MGPPPYIGVERRGLLSGVVRDVAFEEIPGTDPEEDPLLVWQREQGLSSLTLFVSKQILGNMIPLYQSSYYLVKNASCGWSHGRGSDDIELKLSQGAPRSKVPGGGHDGRILILPTKGQLVGQANLGSGLNELPNMSG